MVFRGGGFDMIITCLYCGRDYVVSENEVILWFENPSLEAFRKAKILIWYEQAICKSCLYSISVVETQKGKIYLGKWGLLFQQEESIK